MYGLSRLVQGQGSVLSRCVLQHVRVGGGAFSFGLQTRKETGQATTKESLEEHGFESTTIADILKEKGQQADGSWLWCSVDDTVYDAVKSMTAHNVGALLVVKSGAEKKLAGIITERDYLRKIIVQGRSSKTTKVGDIMTEENKLITVKPDTKVLRAMELMTDNRIRHIPVVEESGMKGMVSIGDVVRAVVDEHREELQRLNSFIQGGY
jgi:CBS domain-containing protein